MQGSAAGAFNMMNTEKGTDENLAHAPFNEKTTPELLKFAETSQPLLPQSLGHANASNEGNTITTANTSLPTPPLVGAVTEAFDNPIPIFPKPLALTYRNLNNHYNKYYKDKDYTVVERGLVVDDLVVSLLKWYFAKPKYTVQKLPLDTKSLIQTVTVDQYITWRVVVEKDDGPATAGDWEASIYPNQEPAIKGRIVLLAAIVREQPFRQLEDRDVPRSLYFSDAVVKMDGTIEVAGQKLQSGHVLVFGARKVPVVKPDNKQAKGIEGPEGKGKNKKSKAKKSKSEAEKSGVEKFIHSPTLEFYSFTAGNRSINPWFGRSTPRPGEFATNIFSFATAEAEEVDRKFRDILSYSNDSPALSQHVSSADTAIAPPHGAQTSTAQGPVIVPNNRTTENDTDEGAGFAFLSQLRMNKAGRLIYATDGKFLPKHKADKAISQAKNKNFKFAPPKHAWKPKSSAKK